MSGTLIGGQKAAQMNKAKDPDFYRKIGSKGGKISKRHLTSEEASAIAKGHGRPAGWHGTTKSHKVAPFENCGCKQCRELLNATAN